MKSQEVLDSRKRTKTSTRGASEAQRTRARLGRALPNTSLDLEHSDPVVDLDDIEDIEEDNFEGFLRAEYHDPTYELPENQNNPLILALPPFHDLNALMRKVQEKFDVAYSPEIRALSKELRLEAVSRINKLVVLFGVHTMLVQWVHTTLRDQYSRYDPLDSRTLEMQRAYHLAQAGEPCVIGADLVKDHAACKLITGLSGMGKTTAVNVAFSTVPQVLLHKKFRGRRFRLRQIVWLHVQCPPNGAVKAFYRSILTRVDEMLGGTNYAKQLTKHDDVETYASKVKIVLEYHRCGILVIDEFQNIMKSAEHTLLVDFLVDMLNKRCCAVLLIGTPEGVRVLNTRLRLARRGTSDGHYEMKPHVEGEEWNRLAGALLDQTYSKKPLSEKNKESLAAELLQRSAGIPALAKLGVRLAQTEAIELDHATLTVRVLTHAMTVNLPSLKVMVDALKAGDAKQLRNILDLASRDADKRYDQARERSEAALESGKVREKETFAGSVSALIEVGVRQIDAERLVREILREAPGLSAEVVVSRALEVRRSDRLSTKVASKSPKAGVSQ